MSKHTPGPWHVIDGAVFEKTYNGFVITDVRKTTEVDQWEANARLIAASPELLKSCKELAEIVAKLNSIHKTIGDVRRCNEAFQVIAKAEGNE